MREEVERRLFEQRAVFVEKAKKIAKEPEMEEKPKKSGGRVGNF